VGRGGTGGAVFGPAGPSGGPVAVPGADGPAPGIGSPGTIGAGPGAATGPGPGVNARGGGAILIPTCKTGEHGCADTIVIPPVISPDDITITPKKLHLVNFMMLASLL